MIIAGNSHVSTFKHGFTLPEHSSESAAVHWVGAIEIDHFFGGHPSAQKIRALFARESGWKVLVIGNHDTFKLAKSARATSTEAALEAMLDKYRQVFAELKAGGNFAWMIGIQQSENAPLAGVSPEEIRDLARRFNGLLAAWCREQGIPVIDPSAQILLESGEPRPELLMADRLHLKPEAAIHYYAAMGEALGVRPVPVPPPSTEPPFEPTTEPESFCALVVEELDLEAEGPRSGADPASLPGAITAFIEERLRDRGLELTLTPDTDFVSSSLLDSLDLVETYTYAIDLLGIDIPFDVNLKELGTARKLSDFLIAHLPAQDGPTAQDFYRSLRGELADPQALVEVEERIATMGAERYERLVEVVRTASGGGLPGYGIVLYWMALVERELGAAARAAELLARSASPALPFPISADRVAACRGRWAGLSDRRGLNIALVPDSPERLKQGLAAYLDAFSPEEDVALHILAGAALAEAEATVLELLAERGVAPEAIPDVTLHPLPERPHQLRHLLGGVEAVIGPEQAVSLGDTLGIAAFEQADAQSLRGLERPGYLVSAIVSTYASERFIRGCLEDLVAQTIAHRLEIIVIDSCSPENEGDIVKEFQRHHRNIRYIRTEERETVYQAWNRGVHAATGKYLTNANTDDRHRVDAFERMVEVLEARPEIALVYADVAITETENETFEHHTPVGSYRWHDWSRRVLLDRGCFMGPQPMWRREVHQEYGDFDPSYVTSGDYEFWLRISQTNDFYHLQDQLGLYLKSPTSVEHRNRERQATENQRLLALYREADLTGRIVRRHYTEDHTHLLAHNHKAEALWAKGAVDAAQAILTQIVEVAPQLPTPLNNLGVIAYQHGQLDEAIAYFRRAVEAAPDHAEARENLESCLAAKKSASLP